MATKKNTTKEPATSAVKETATTGTLDTPTSPANTERQNDLPDTAATSSVTTDLPSSAEEDPKAAAKAYDEMPTELKNSIGLVKVDGIDFRYVGVAPSREIADGGDPKAETGLSISGLNSSFTPLAEVPFSNSIRVKDPKSGKFYYPGEGCTSWKDCELDGSYLIER